MNCVNIDFKKFHICLGFFYSFVCIVIFRKCDAVKLKTQSFKSKLESLQPVYSDLLGLIDHRVLSAPGACALARTPATMCQLHPNRVSKK